MDDILLAGNDDNFITDLIMKLGTEFSIKNLGSLHCLLPGGFFLSLQKYIHELVSQTKILESNPQATPMTLQNKFKSLDSITANATLFRSIVGALQYLTFTRPDITYAINKVCQHFRSPTLVNLKSVKRNLRYPAGTQAFGIRYISFSKSFHSLYLL